MTVVEISSDPLALGTDATAEDLEAYRERLQALLCRLVGVPIIVRLADSPQPSDNPAADRLVRELHSGDGWLRLVEPEPDPAEEIAQGLMHDEAAALREHEQQWIERYQSGEVRASDVPKDLLPAVLASGAPRVSYTERRKQQRTEGPLGSRWKGVP